MLGVTRNIKIGFYYQGFMLFICLLFVLLLYLLLYLLFILLLYLFVIYLFYYKFVKLYLPIFSSAVLIFRRTLFFGILILLVKTVPEK